MRLEYLTDDNGIAAGTVVEPFSDGVAEILLARGTVRRLDGLPRVPPGGSVPAAEPGDRQRGNRPRNRQG